MACEEGEGQGARVVMWPFFIGVINVLTLRIGGSGEKGLREGMFGDGVGLMEG